MFVVLLAKVKPAGARRPGICDACAARALLPGHPCPTASHGYRVSQVRLAVRSRPRPSQDVLTLIVGRRPPDPGWALPAAGTGHPRHLRVRPRHELTGGVR